MSYPDAIRPGASVVADGVNFSVFSKDATLLASSCCSLRRQRAFRPPLTSHLRSSRASSTGPITTGTRLVPARAPARSTCYRGQAPPRRERPAFRCRQSAARSLRARRRRPRTATTRAAACPPRRQRRIRHEERGRQWRPLRLGGGSSLLPPAVCRRLIYELHVRGLHAVIRARA